MAGAEDRTPKKGPTEEASGPRTRTPSLDGIDITVDGTSIPPTSIPPNAPPSIPPLARVGRWELLGRLAVGGMAEIYLANERMGGGGKRRVVIKLVRPAFAGDSEFEKMFVTEGRVVTQLAHPQICHVYEFGKLDDRYFIAMEWVDGATLLELCRRFREAGGPVPVTLLVRIAADIAGALHFVHRLKDRRGRRLGIVHRDVSPQNIMISYDGSVKLLDFGVATQRNEVEVPESASGTIKGKFAYMSPEQCSAQPVDGRSDIFSLAVCLHEALTGRALFKRSAPYETLRAVVEATAPSIREVDATLPVAIDEILRKALAKNPRDRFETAGKMQEALEQYLVDRRATVLATQISGVMEKLFASAIEKGPTLDRSDEAKQRVTALQSMEVVPLDDSELAPLADVSEPTGVQRLSPETVPVPAHTAEPASAPSARARPPYLWIGLGVAALVAIGITAIVVSSGQGSPPVVRAPVVAPIQIAPAIVRVPVVVSQLPPPPAVIVPPVAPFEAPTKAPTHHHHSAHFATDPGF